MKKTSDAVINKISETIHDTIEKTDEENSS